jgi:hypothetical protein
MPWLEKNIGTNIRILVKIIRFAAIAVAVLFIGLSLVGICGAWVVDRKATDIALKGFGLIETEVQVVDAGVGRVNELVATSGQKCGRLRKPSPRSGHRRRRTALYSTR